MSKSISRLSGEGAAISGQTTYLDSQEYHSKTTGPHYRTGLPIQIHPFFSSPKKTKDLGFNKHQCRNLVFLMGELLMDFYCFESDLLWIDWVSYNVALTIVTRNRSKLRYLFRELGGRWNIIKFIQTQDMKAKVAKVVCGKIDLIFWYSIRFRLVLFHRSKRFKHWTTRQVFPEPSLQWPLEWQKFSLKRTAKATENRQRVPRNFIDSNHQFSGLNWLLLLVSGYLSTFPHFLNCQIMTWHFIRSLHQPSRHLASHVLRAATGERREAWGASQGTHATHHASWHAGGRSTSGSTGRGRMRRWAHTPYRIYGTWILSCLIHKFYNRFLARKPWSGHGWWIWCFSSIQIHFSHTYLVSSSSMLFKKFHRV